MLQNKKFLITYKLFFALLAFSAVVMEMATLIERGTFKPANFFSFFTIETNILVVLTLLLSAIAVAAGKNKRLDVLRGAVTVYILIVGIGFSFLLSGLENVALTAVPWDNTVLHYIIPAAVLIDFLLDRPKSKLSFKRSIAWLLFPIGYGVYGMTRGLLTGWYPYPFLNPATNGYGAIAITMLCLFVLGLALVWAIVRLSGKNKS